MHVSSTSARGAALAIAFAACSFSARAAAPLDESSATELEKIDVVGTNIKRVDIETSSSIQVLTKDDIAKSGATTVTELLQNLPAAANSANYLNDISGSASFAPGASSLSLRGMGENSTLILLNGRRLPSFGLANFQDLLTNLDAIALDAVEQVQVLKSGASAIYGSSAVAGVVNIITRKDFDGVELRADRQQSLTSGEFGSSAADITAGKGNLASDGYNVVSNLDIYHRASTMWTHLLGYVNKGVTSPYPLFGTYSTLSPAGNYLDFNTGAAAAGTPCNAPNLVQNGTCNYPRYNDVQAVPESDRINFLGSGNLRVNGDLTAFGEVSYSHLRTTYILPYPTYRSSPAATTWYNAQSGNVLSFVAPFLSGSSTLNPFSGLGDDAELRYRFTDAPKDTWTTASQYRVLGGLKGIAGKYEWETAAGIMGSRATNVGYSMSASGFQKTIGDYTTAALDSQGAPTISDPNFFQQPGGYRIGGPNSAAVINALFPQNDTTGKQTQYFADGKISGDLLQLPAGPLAFAAGLNLNEEKYTLVPSDNLLNGDIIGNGISTADSSRFYSAAFGELNVPLLKRLEAQLAGRVDKFPDFAAHVSPKVGLRYEASDAVLLRGTFETGFRAPSLLESARSTKISYVGGLNDPTRCPQATALANDLLSYYQTILNSPSPTATQLALANGAFTRSGLVGQNECGATLTQISTYNPDLKPETSNSFGLGIVLEPVKGYSAAFDYFNIKRKNQINRLGLQQILNGNVPAGTVVNRAPVGTRDPTFLAHDPVFGGQSDFTLYGVTAGPVQYIQHGFQNLGNQQTSGIDINARIKSRPIGIGTLDLDLNATYTASFQDDQVDLAYENLAGRYGYPKWNAYSTVSYTVHSITNAIRVNFQDATSLNQSTGDGFDLAGCASIGWSAGQCRVASYTTFDYFIQYSAVKNVVIHADLRNVFARKYPTDLRAVYGSSGEIPVYLQDAQGRMLKVSVQYRF